MELPCLHYAFKRFQPIGGRSDDDKGGQQGEDYGCKRTHYWADRALTGFAGPDYDAAISFRMPYGPETSQCGESRF